MAKNTELEETDVIITLSHQPTKLFYWVIRIHDTFKLLISFQTNFKQCTVPGFLVINPM